MRNKSLESLLDCTADKATEKRLREWFALNILNVELSHTTLLAHKDYLDAQFIDFHKNHILPKMYYEVGAKLLRDQIGKLTFTEASDSRTDIVKISILKEPERTVETAILAFSKKVA